MIAVQEKETSVDSHTLVEAAVPPQIVNNEAPKGVFVTGNEPSKDTLLLYIYRVLFFSLSLTLPPCIRSHSYQYYFGLLVGFYFAIRT